MSLVDEIRKEHAEDAFNDGIFEAVCRCVKDVNETLKAHGKPELSLFKDDALTDALMETINTALNEVA